MKETGLSDMSVAEVEMLRMIGDRLKSLEERITQSDAASTASRSRMHQDMEALGRTCLTIDLRLQAAEKALALASPTIQEVMDTKMKVKGGGILALGLWKLAVLSIAGAAFLYSIWDRLEAVFRALFHAPK